jgi:type IV secretion system protein VirD4
VTHYLVIVLTVGGGEIALWLWARWEAWRHRYDSALMAWLAIHWRLVSRLFMIAAALLICFTRWAWHALAASEHTRRMIDAAAGRYWRLHAVLEGCLAIGMANLHRGIRRATPVPIKRFVYPHQRAGSLAVLAHGTGSVSGPGAALQSSRDPGSGSSGGEYAVVWHGRVVNVFLGLVAGLVAAGVVWLTGLYRLPGAAGHAVAGIGPLGLVISVCTAAGLGLGMVAHQHPHSIRAPGDGFAKRRDIRRAISARAVRRSAAITRPGMAAKRLPVTHSGTFLGWRGGTKLWATLKDVVLVIAPPQTGKTAYLGGRIIEAPGAVVATSTKADIFVHTVALRAARGSVWVLNTEGLGDIASNFRWSPLEGCCDPEVASERAGYLLAGIEKGGGENAFFWREMNVKLLRCLLLAAAVTDRNMRDVWAWINDSADPTPLRIMESEPTVPGEWVSEFGQLLHDTPERTRQSVYLTLAQAMQFITSPAVASAICPAPGEPTFSLDQFLNGDATLYLLGSDRPYASLVPLFTAITGHVFEGAKRAAGRAYNGRLDPPLSLVLDEAALICPVPLPSMTADSGGRGIQVLTAVQSPSQLYERWGQRGGETIWNNANAKLVFGGLGHARDLDDLSKVCGERDEHVQGTTTASGGHRSASTTIRRVPVLAPHEIRQLADGQALLLYRNIPPVVIKTEKVWERKDVKAMAKARRNELASARVRASTAAAPVEIPSRAQADVGNIVVLADRRDDDERVEEEAAAGGE